ncbi:hypothetical protein F5Y07DRAFT_290851 [Xylaria sp. FL0933]|nr:hypothetical protein F5Y07DRAFT_290851 [Xylaria sp. FL0933]
MITPRSFLHARRPSPSFPQPGPPTFVPASPTKQPRRPPHSKYDFSSSHLRASEQQPLEVVLDRISSEVVLSRSDTFSPQPECTPSTTMATTAARPITPTSAVQIPIKQKNRPHKTTDRARSSSTRRRAEVHSPDAIPPAVAALLAITNIPPPKRRRSLQQKERRHPRMTVDSIVPRSKVSEKDLSQELHFDLSEDLSPASFERSPLEFLLTPPDALEEDVLSHTDSGFASPYSTRTQSFDSLPSLGDSLSQSAVPSSGSPITPRGGRIRSPRRSLEPVTTPPGELPTDPLSKVSIENDQLDFSVKPTISGDKQTQIITPFRSVFKSNLTASLRALRSAARTLSTFTTSSIPPDDFLTRSILTIDPRVPFTDERRPPVLEEEPSEAMRRYLNPSSNIRPEVRGSSPIRSYTASIQMQTYKVQRSRGVPRARQASNANKSSTVALLPPGPRQREMRENPDFIRIAVMEHLMRKRGKLDDQREGHARWLLPPRKADTKPYEIGPGGVPVRWIATVQDD